MRELHTKLCGSTSTSSLRLPLVFGAAVPASRAGIPDRSTLPRADFDQQADSGSGPRTTASGASAGPSTFILIVHRRNRARELARKAFGRGRGRRRETIRLASRPNGG